MAQWHLAPFFLDKVTVYSIGGPHRGMKGRQTHTRAHAVRGFAPPPLLPSLLKLTSRLLLGLLWCTLATFPVAQKEAWSITSREFWLRRREPTLQWCRLQCVYNSARQRRDSRRSRSEVAIRGTSFSDRRRRSERSRYITLRALNQTHKFWIYCCEGRKRVWESLQSEVRRRLASYSSALPPWTNPAEQRFPPNQRLVVLWSQENSR